MSHVETQNYFARNDIARARFGFNLTDRGNDPWVITSEHFDANDEASGGNQRIPTQSHWRRAGMRSFSDETHSNSCLTGNGSNDANGLIFFFQHGTLLNMYFHIAEQEACVVLCAREGVGVAAIFADGLSHC